MPKPLNRAYKVYTSPAFRSCEVIKIPVFLQLSIILILRIFCNMYCNITASQIHYSILYGKCNISFHIHSIRIIYITVYLKFCLYCYFYSHNFRPFPIIRFLYSSRVSSSPSFVV